MGTAKTRKVDEVLTLAEAAAILRISITTAKIEAAAGRLPAFKAGKAWRITRANLDAYMKQGSRS